MEHYQNVDYFQNLCSHAKSFLYKNTVTNFDEDFKSVFENYIHFNYFDLFFLWFDDELSQYFYNKIISDIKISRYNQSHPYEVLDKLYLSINHVLLFCKHLSCFTKIESFNICIIEKIQSILLPNLDETFLEHLEKIYRSIAEKVHLFDESLNLDIRKATKFKEINKKMQSVHLWKNLCQCYAVDAYHNAVVKTVKYRASSLKNMNLKIIPELKQWLIIFRNKYCNLLNDDNLNEINSDQQFNILYEAVAEERIKNIFMLVIHYPESKESLLELKCCLDKVPRLKHNFIKELKSALSKRLLHAGVATTEILTAYASVVKVCLILVGSDNSIASLTRPITEYLRRRNDTVRCLVKSVVDDENDIDLSSFESSKFDPESWRKWIPPSRHIESINLDESQKDTFNALVDDLGGSDLLVKEYAEQLAERMLNSPGNLKVDDEIRRIEALKSKFGEPALSACDVMMVDLKESNRIRNCMKKKESAEIKSLYDTNTLILSEHYWPKLKEEDIRLPIEIEQRFEKFTGDYQKIKEGRTLKWHKQLGTVKMTLELADRKIEVSSTPAHAALINLFTLNDEPWASFDLAKESGMTTAAVKKRMGVWIKEGVIRIQPDGRYILNLLNTSTTGDEMLDDEDSDIDEKENSSSKTSRKGNIGTVWLYIQGVLRTMESLPKDKLMKVLAMFSAHFSSQEIQSLLSEKVKSGQLEFSDGVYRL